MQLLYECFEVISSFSGWAQSTRVKSEEICKKEEEKGATEGIKQAELTLPLCHREGKSRNGSTWFILPHAERFGKEEHFPF